MRNYASFYEKLSFPSIIVYAYSIHIYRAFSVNMIVIIKDYYFPKFEDITFFTSRLISKNDI